MMKVLTSAIQLLTLVSACTHATADTFGTGANQFEIEFVEIGDPGNAPDTTGCDEFSACRAPNPNPAGTVDYIYRIGKFEVSKDMVDKANAEAGLGITLSDFPSQDWPATEVSWNEAARFVNWLNTSQGYPPAYKFAVQPGDAGYDSLLNQPNGLSLAHIELWEEGDAGFDAVNRFRNGDARYFLPSAHEWYKAAYYDPATGDYWDYPTGSNTTPTAVAGGTEPNAVVYGQEFRQGPADVTQAGGLSPYGVMGLGGNASEWEESTFDLRNGSGRSQRGGRGGDWTNTEASFWPSIRGPGADPQFAHSLQGFRVASVPEPRGVVLALVAVTVLLKSSTGWLTVRTNSIRDHEKDHASSRKWATTCAARTVTAPFAGAVDEQQDREPVMSSTATPLGGGGREERHSLRKREKQLVEVTWPPHGICFGRVNSRPECHGRSTRDFETAVCKSNSILRVARCTRRFEITPI